MDDREDHFGKCVQQHLTAVLREQDEVLEEDSQDGARKRVLIVVFLVEKLDDQLDKYGFDLILVVGLAQLDTEEHLADSLDGDLPEHFVWNSEVLVGQQLEKGLRMIIGDPMHD